MLTCKHLHVALPEGRVLIDDLSFSLNAGDRIGVISEEGNGKSTLLKILAGDAPDYVSVSGFYSVEGTIALMYQQIPPVWMQSTPLEFLLKNDPHNEIEAEDWNRLGVIEKTAARIGLSSDLIYAQRNIATCSGGEKVKLQILKLLSRNPDILMLDEPTNDLDLETLEWMENWLLSLRIPVLFVSHDVKLLEQCASAILHIEARNKKTKPVSTFFSGSYKDYLEGRQAVRAKTLQVARSDKREYMAQKQRLNDLHNKVEGKLRTVSRQMPNVAKNLKDKMRSVKSSQAILERSERTQTDSAEEEIQFFLSDASIAPDKIVLDWTDMTIANDERTLVDAFDLKIAGRERVLICGANGSGKSTMIDRMMDDLSQRPDLNVGFMPQDYDRQFAEFKNAIEFLEQYCEDRNAITLRLGSLHFQYEEMLQPLDSLSGGQKAKVYLAALSLQSCTVLVLDEPTRNLSPLSVPVLCQALADYNGCVIAVSHDRYFMEHGFTRRLSIESGRLVDRLMD